jgi:heat shock protein HspQ
MRSITHLKVEGHDALIRDVSSHAIINNDDAAYRAYVAKRDLQKKKAEELSQLKEEVQELKNDIGIIKELLLSMSKGKE